MNNINGYWVDKNDNSWNSKNYTKTEAIKYSKSLVNCKGCIDCYNCKGCVSCLDCVDSRYCVGCRCCLACLDCAYCMGCNKCVDCESEVSKDEKKW